MTLILGVAGQAPIASVRLQDSYQVGRTGIVVANVDNRWWGRNMTVLSVSISIAGGTPIELLPAPEPIAPALPQPSRTLPLTLNLTVPQGTPSGTQIPYQIKIVYIQSQILFFGQDKSYFDFNGTMEVRYY
jgi:hypothetical protein